MTYLVSITDNPVHRVTRTSAATIHAAKDFIAEELRAMYADAPADVSDQAEELIDRLNAHRGTGEFHDAYLDITVAVTEDGR